MPAVPSDTTEPTTFVEVPLSRQDIINCSYSNWYSKFKDHVWSRCTILKPVPKAFLDYLGSDEFTIPKEASNESALFNKVVPTSDNEYSDWSADEDAVTESAKIDPSIDFSEFHEQIKTAVKNYKRISPKLNWSAPKDATWIMTNNTMECQSASDIYLLLKSSDYINHDLHHAFDGLDDDEQKGDDVEDNSDFEYELILREWKEINPSMEFRCFVRDRQLIAISQRDLNYYEFLDDIQDTVLDKIGIFFDDVLMPKADSNNFVFDVYIPKSLSKVYLIDINPFSRKTDPLLFTWNELATLKVNEDSPDFRLVNKHNSGRFASKEHVQNHVPKDIVDATMDSAAMAELAQQWQRMLAKEQDEESESSDDE